MTSKKQLQNLLISFRSWIWWHRPLIRIKLKNKMLKKVFKIHILQAIVLRKQPYNLQSKLQPLHHLSSNITLLVFRWIRTTKMTGVAKKIRKHNLHRHLNQHLILWEECNLEKGCKLLISQFHHKNQKQHHNHHQTQAWVDWVSSQEWIYQTQINSKIKHHRRNSYCNQQVPMNLAFQHMEMQNLNQQLKNQRQH